MRQILRFTLLVILLAGLALPRTALASPVSVQVTGADVRSVLLSVARMANMSLVFDDGIAGRVTANVTDEPENILRYIVRTQGLALVQEGNVFLVTSARKSSALSSVHVYKIRYGNPEDFARIVNLSLRTGGNLQEIANTENESGSLPEDTASSDNFGREDGTSRQEADGFDAAKASRAGESDRVRVDAATSSLVFYGTGAEADMVKSVLERLDVPAKQVALEAKVVALSKDASKSLGVTWEWSTLPQTPDVNERVYRRGTSNESVDEDVTRHYNGKDYVPGIIQFGHGPNGYPFEFYYEAKLNALVTDGKAQILARPNVTTVQGREAVINIGTDVPISTETTSNQITRTTYKYRKAGIILRCTPQVNEDGEITAHVHTEVSTPYYVDTLKAYRFQERSADTTVRLKDGETMVIGGLIGKEESRQLEKVPFLGDIPILGALFRSVSHSKQDTEITIFLTARVVG